VGTIEPRKNLSALLDAYALLRQHAVTDDTKLVMVGKKGWLYEPFFQHLHELGLEDQVIFPGYVADEELPALYGAAEVFVFPSLFEGFGLPVLEAMACGAPVVCSNATSLPEVAGDAALMVSPQDTAGLATAIQRVLADAELRAKLASLGMAQARRFTWEETARQTLAVYQQVYEKSDGKT
jgi:glycosyltransferase involved in cell wall biosynthesis